MTHGNSIPDGRVRSTVGVEEAHLGEGLANVVEDDRVDGGVGAVGAVGAVGR